MIVPPIVDDSHFLAAEEKGDLLSFGVFDDDVLVGFLVCELHWLPKYSTTSAIVQALYIMKEHRVDNNGRMLIDLAAKTASEYGATIMMISAPSGGALEKAARLFRFKPTNTLYSRAI